MTIWGHTKDNQILIDEKIQLPDGIQVEIRVPDEEITPGTGACGIWKDPRETEETIGEIDSSKLRPVGIDRGLTIPPSFFDPLPDDLLNAFCDANKELNPSRPCLSPTRWDLPPNPLPTRKGE